MNQSRSSSSISKNANELMQGFESIGHKTLHEGVPGFYDGYQNMKIIEN